MVPDTLIKKNKLIRFDHNLTKTLSNYYLIGIDEVGRGALAGPVIACAFTWNDEINWKEIKKSYGLLQRLNDSKQLKASDRNELFDLLSTIGSCGIGYASVLEIERLNVLNATFLAMKRAFDTLMLKLKKAKKQKPYLLIDGNKFNPYINCLQVPIIAGDAKSSAIASASIIAKVYRDMLMRKISKIEKYKYFIWDRNVGYGTKAHITAIKKIGLTPFHRKLFVRKIFSLEEKLQVSLKD